MIIKGNAAIWQILAADPENRVIAFEIIRSVCNFVQRTVIAVGKCGAGQFPGSV
ncbi:MAG: hypothetical protein ACLUOI_31070 [Eisenbergiella sp.]